MHVYECVICTGYMCTSVCMYSACTIYTGCMLRGEHWRVTKHLINMHASIQHTLVALTFIQYLCTISNCTLCCRLTQKAFIPT